MLFFSSGKGCQPFLISGILCEKASNGATEDETITIATDIVMTATVSEVFVTEQNEDTNKQTQSQVYVPGITPRPKKTTVFKELGEDSKRFSNTALFPTNLKVS